MFNAALIEFNFKGLQRQKNVLRTPWVVIKQNITITEIKLCNGIVFAKILQSLRLLP